MPTHADLDARIATRDQAVAEMLEAEQAARRQKTERLRALRLSRDTEPRNDGRQDEEGQAGPQPRRG
jgi:hypothetical protein